MLSKEDTVIKLIYSELKKVAVLKEYCMISERNWLL